MRTARSIPRGVRSACAGAFVSLKPKTFDLLVYLVTHAGRVVTKEELLSALWPDSYIEERNLSQHVFLLRKALAVQSVGDRLIATIPGRGYQFTAQVVSENCARSAHACRLSPQYGRRHDLQGRRNHNCGAGGGVD